MSTTNLQFSHNLLPTFSILTHRYLIILYIKYQTGDPHEQYQIKQRNKLIFKCVTNHPSKAHFEEFPNNFGSWPNTSWGEPEILQILEETLQSLKSLGSGTMPNTFFSPSKCIWQHINCPILQIFLHETITKASTFNRLSVTPPLPIIYQYKRWGKKDMTREANN